MYLMHSSISCVSCEFSDVGRHGIQSAFANKSTLVAVDMCEFSNIGGEALKSCEGDRCRVTRSLLDSLPISSPGLVAQASDCVSPSLIVGGEYPTPSTSTSTAAMHGTMGGSKKRSFQEV